MDKVQALQEFWSGFSWPAIDEQSAYDEGTLEQMQIDFPYITYEVATDAFDAPVAIGADLWDRSTSWARIAQKAEEIDFEISRGGKIIPYDGGAVWVTRGTPFSQRMAAQEVSSASGYDIRRIHININAEFISA